MGVIFQLVMLVFRGGKWNHTVDGRNPIIYRVFAPSQVVGLGISEPSTVSPTANWVVPASPHRSNESSISSMLRRGHRQAEAKFPPCRQGDPSRGSI